MDRPESRSAQVHHAAAILAALGDPIRLSILMCLASEELRVKDLCDIFGGSQANVSGHRVADSRVQVVVAAATAMAQAVSDNDPGEARASGPTPILDLLREHRDTITKNRKALDAIQLRGLRTSMQARGQSLPQRRG